ITVFAKDRLLTLEVKTGTPAAPPVTLPPRRESSPDSRELPRFFDAAGNGELTVLLMKHVRSRDLNDPASSSGLEVQAVQAVTGERLWSVVHDGLGYEHRLRDRALPPWDWPLPVARPGGGQDLLLPFREGRPRNQPPESWHGVELRDGRTGQSR